MSNESRHHRLFFALWPTQTVRQSILDVFSPFGTRLTGVAIQPRNLHITLHFIGNVSTQKKQCLHQAAHLVTAKPFTINLDCFGHFSRARVFWMGMSQIPAELLVLQSRMADSLRTNCEFQQDARPYQPHISLLRKYRVTSAAAEEVMYPSSKTISWAIEQFVLLESRPSVQGVEYRVVENYPLTCDK